MMEFMLMLGETTLFTRKHDYLGVELYEVIQHTLHSILYYRDAVEENHKVPFEFVKWEYRVDFA